MRFSHIFLAVFVALLWGFSFVVIEVGLGEFPPLLFAALRFSCAAFPAVLFFNHTGISWRWIVAMGLSMLASYILLFVGMKAGLPAGQSSIVLQIQVVFTLLMSGVVLHDSPTAWQKIGVAVAIGGIVLLAVSKYETPTFLGLMLVVCAGFAWAMSNIVMKLAGQVDMLRLVVWMSLVPPVPLLLASLVFEEGQVQNLAGLTWTGAGAVLYTGLVSTILAYAIWGRLLKTHSVNVVAPFSLLVPVFGILSSVLVLNERFTTPEAIAMGLVFLGLAMVVLGSRLSSALLSLRHPGQA